LRYVFEPQGTHIIAEYAKNLFIKVVLLNPRRLVGIVNVISPYFGSLAIHAKYDVILVRIPFFTDFLDVVVNMLIKRINEHLVVYDVIDAHIDILKRKPSIGSKVSMKNIVTAIYQNNIILVETNSIHHINIFNISYIFKY
jgi:hypothetical protein